MKYKIQIPNAYGEWCDYKSGDGDETDYEVELYDTEEDAQLEAGTAIEGLDDFEYRIVPENTPQEVDLYDG